MRPLLFFLPALILVGAWLVLRGAESTPPDTDHISQPPGHPPDPPPARTGLTTPRQLEYAFSDETGFRRMGKPKAREWLDVHDEPGQTFAEYVRSRPVTAKEGSDVLAFIPVGEFREDEKAVADATFRFAGLWFGRPVKVLGRADLPKEGFQRVREFPWSREPVTQYRTDWFLSRLLPPRLPANAVMLAAVTSADLYPSDDWNYVFGIASLRRRIGVYSIRRYFPRFWGRPPSPDSSVVALRRAIKLMTHELGHCFGVLHCISYECGMNGSNSLAESDGRPIFLCPVCLKKLQWNLGFDVLERYERLLAFYEAEGLAVEARWTKERIIRISAIR